MTTDAPLICRTCGVERRNNRPRQRSGLIDGLERTLKRRTI